MEMFKLCSAIDPHDQDWKRNQRFQYEPINFLDLFSVISFIEMDLRRNIWDGVDTLLQRGKPLSLELWKSNLWTIVFLWVSSLTALYMYH